MLVFQEKKMPLPPQKSGPSSTGEELRDLIVFPWIQRNKTFLNSDLKHKISINH